MLIKKAERWGERGKASILKGRINFLNRNGEKFDWDNDDLSKIKVVKNQPIL